MFELTCKLETVTAEGYWGCTCGKAGQATRAFPGEDLKSKAKRNWRMHFRRATGRV